MKRATDIVLSGLALIAFLPLLAVIVVWISLDSPGPAFYRGVRVGRFGKRFRIFKFRTMVMNAEKLGGSSTADDDPRLTRLGKFLRRHKLDELPQLINVLKGEMSFVGPRPEVSHYVEMFTEEEQAILTVRPGITDWASLWNWDEGAVLAGSPDPEETYAQKIRPLKIGLQLEYVRKQSFWTDLRIIFQTLMAIILRPKPRALEIVSDKGLGCRHKSTRMA